MTKFMWCLFLMTSCAQSNLYGMNLYRKLELFAAWTARPTHKAVFMNDSSKISLLSGTKKEEIISTGGLVGCIVTLLYAKNKEGSLQELVMTYYARGNNLHQEVLRGHIMQLKSDYYAHCIVIRPVGKNAFFTDRDDSICQDQVKQLQEMVRKHLHVKNLDMTIGSYGVPVPGQSLLVRVCGILSNDKNLSRYKIEAISDQQSLLDIRTQNE